MNKLIRKAAAFITAGLMATAGLGAQSFAAGSSDSTASVKVAYEATVAKPTYSIKGTKGVRKIKLSSTTSGAQIYYTTNGTTPTKASRKYTNGTLLKITKDVKIKAIAVYGGTSSAVMIKTFKVATKYGDITGDGNINSNDYARLKNYINNKTSYVCKDNADCDGDGNITLNDLSVLQMYLNGTITALPYTGGVEIEDPEEDEEDAGSAVSVTLPRPGITVYKSLGGKRVEFTSSTSGVSYYYTLNGADPTTRSLLYTDKFLIDKAGTYTVKVIAYKNGSTSAVQKTTVTVGQTAAVTCPVSTSTTYADSVTISLACTTENASIYYTTDGTDPRTSSTAKKYTKTFDLLPNANTDKATVKAYARSKANADSTVASFTFNIKANFTLSGTVWDDTPYATSLMDGVKSNGEAGISGIKVYALNVNNNTKVKETTTDANGNYTLSGLMPSNTYRVVFEFNYVKYRPYTLTKNGGNQALLSSTLPQLTIKSGGAYNATGTLISTANKYTNASTYSGFMAQATSANAYTATTSNINLALSTKSYGQLTMSVESTGAYTTATSSVPSIMQDEKLTYKITLTNASASETLSDVAIGLYFTDGLSNINMVKGTNNVYVTSNFDGTRNGFRYYTITNLIPSSGLAAGQSVSFTVSGNVNADIGKELKCFAEVTAYRFAAPIYDYFSTPGSLGGPNTPKEKDEATTAAVTVISASDNTTNATISLIDSELYSRSGRYIKDLYQGQSVTAQIYFEGIKGSSDYALEAYDGTCVRHTSSFKKLGSGYLLELTVTANTSAIPGVAYYNIYIKKDPSIKLALSFNVLSIYENS